MATWILIDGRGLAIRPRDLRHYSYARVETYYEALRRFTEASDPEPWRRFFTDAVAECRRAPALSPLTADTARGWP